MKILVRLPNWLGDMVMSVGLLHQLPHFFPGAKLSVIAKKGIHELMPLFPEAEHQFVFSKEAYKGTGGVMRFGRELRAKEKFDLFLCLPNSFSAALMGYAAGSPVRIGYKNELRQLLLTHSYSRVPGGHRALEYIRLAERFTGIDMLPPDVSLRHSFQKADHIVVNINSEASSRRLTVTKAVELLDALRTDLPNPIILVGAPKEKEFVDTVLSKVGNRAGIESRAGNTTLPALAELLASARLLLSTDSGPAHLANALGTPTVVLFGAGNEAHTAPYRQDLRQIVRLNALECEPCERNICARFDTPQCLEQLRNVQILEAIHQIAQR